MFFHILHKITSILTFLLQDVNIKFLESCGVSVFAKRLKKMLTKWQGGGVKLIYQEHTPTNLMCGYVTKEMMRNEKK